MSRCVAGSTCWIATRLKDAESASRGRTVLRSPSDEGSTRINSRRPQSESSLNKPVGCCFPAGVVSLFIFLVFGSLMFPTLIRSSVGTRSLIVPCGESLHANRMLLTIQHYPDSSLRGTDLKSGDFKMKKQVIHKKLLGTRASLVVARSWGLLASLLGTRTLGPGNCIEKY